MAGGSVTDVRNPGNRESCGLICCAICAADTGRVARGVRFIWNVATFMLPVPVDAWNASMYGFFLTISATLSVYADIS